jgi:hypothetical protein
MTEYSNADNLFEGVVQGCLYGQQDRVDALNNRIIDRQFPDIELRPNYDPRSVSTKYIKFAITDPIQKKSEFKSYNCNTNSSLGNSKLPVFYSGSNNAPSLRNIDIETNLRNQTVALQHGAYQSIYVPSSKSELYNIEIPKSSLEGEQPFPELFNQTKTHNSIFPSISNNINIGKQEFFNHTRTQLRNTILM